VILYKEASDSLCIWRAPCVLSKNQLGKWQDSVFSFTKFWTFEDFFLKISTFLKIRISKADYVVKIILNFLKFDYVIVKGEIFERLPPNGFGH